MDQQPAKKKHVKDYADVVDCAVNERARDLSAFDSESKILESSGFSITNFSRFVSTEYSTGFTFWYLFEQHFFSCSFWNLRSIAISAVLFFHALLVGIFWSQQNFVRGICSKTAKEILSGASMAIFRIVLHVSHWGGGSRLIFSQSSSISSCACSFGVYCATW